MKLYGSTTSPFVRRLRIYLAERDYELVKVNIFGEERTEIKKINPTLKIPMLEDNDNPDCPTLTDSNLIYQYLSEKYSELPLTLAEQNTLAIINGCNDSLVNMMILTRSKVDTSQDKLYFNIQRERNKATFDHLEQLVGAGSFSSWNYLAISLLVLIEWAMFRNLYDFSKYPNLMSFVEANSGKPGVQETKPVE